MSESGGLCRCCAGFTFTLGLTALLLWLSFRAIRPRYYLTAFSLPPTPANSTASFQLEVENKNRRVGIDYDPLAVSLAFNRTALGGPTFIPAFYQGHKKTAVKGGNLTVARSRATWPAAVKNGTAVFTVAVESAFRYKVLSWHGRHHRVSVAADVAVDAAGMKTARKGIRLNSAAPAVSVGLLMNGVSALLAWRCMDYY